LKQAARDGSSAPVDERDPGAVYQERQVVEESVWAFVAVMAEAAEQTVELIRAREETSSAAFALSSPRPGRSARSVLVGGAGAVCWSA
jgi:hypothetical protein